MVVDAAVTHVSISRKDAFMVVVSLALGPPVLANLHQKHVLQLPTFVLGALLHNGSSVPVICQAGIEDHAWC